MHTRIHRFVGVPVSFGLNMCILLQEKPEGIIVQFGGQTPLKIATTLHEYLKEHPVPAAGGERPSSTRGVARGARPLVHLQRSVAACCKWPAVSVMH